MRSPPWCSGEKRGSYVKIIFMAQIIRDPICSQFWARVRAAYLLKGTVTVSGKDSEAGEKPIREIDHDRFD